MLKNIPLLFVILPFAIASAEELNTIQIDDSTTTVTSDEKASILANEKTIDISHSTEYFFSQCYRNVPPIIKESNPLPNNQVPIKINAKSIQGTANTLIYNDNVELTQGIKYLKADKLTYLKEEDKALAEGNVNFVNGEVTLSSDNIETHLDTDQKKLQQVDYQFHGQGGRGSAAQIYDDGSDLYELKSSSYSACPPGDNTWTLDASTLYIDNESGVGSAYNAVLKIKDVPVFYLPYITYPISDKRRTGLLFPTYTVEETNGLTITAPLYINIAENMDMTITPTYMENRGTLLDTQYRYLFDIGSGTLAGQYLSNDKVDEEYDTRYLYHWNHSVNFAQNWKLTTEYTKVSDDDYFTDFDTDYGSYSDNQLLQTASLTYTKTNWNSELEVRDFQILDLDDDDDTSHKVLPKLAFTASKPLGWKSLQIDWYSEITRFEHSSEDVYTGTRIHFEPKISLPLYYNAFFLNTELKYMVSLYEQSIPTGTSYLYDDLEEDVTRNIPSFKINSGLNFERDFTAFESEYKQTLVPQVQYLYVPYQDQSNIGLYDTTEMEEDYYALFRENRFSGYDRIADANLITFGISSNILNAQGQQKIHFAVGQNYYFHTSKTIIPDYDDSDDDSDTVSGSEIIGEFDINFDNQYFFHSGMEWNADENEIESANSAIEKRWAYNTYLQLNYRYVAIGDDDDDEDLVNQLGTKFNWSMNDQWTSYGSYYYDLEYNRPYESLIGIKYQNCCWSIGLSYNEYISDVDTSSDTWEYETESGYSINFELTGLGGAGTGDSVDTQFTYGRPFYLQ